MPDVAVPLVTATSSSRAGLLALPRHGDARTDGAGDTTSANDVTVENFFSLVQNNVLNRHRWDSRRQLRTAIVFVLTSGCSWRQLPPSFRVSVPTAHRRFPERTQAGVWRYLHRAVLDELGSVGELDWERAIVDGASVRAKNGVPQPDPTSSTAARTGRSCTS
ncbi:transposase [Saccharopolyspora sp. HNM0983]|uniref:Transposase n=1 Tax=Saccharopolyspora montiporae TaxID=2781240 RepID=A0A929B5X5_9PSEU|nr:transposase [Saccharopolyspora sp. HNM0983]